jgi:transcription antitermination factor NusG
MTKVVKTMKKRRKKSGKGQQKSLFPRTPRDFSGFRFRDEEGEYDVPFIDEPMWFRLQVRKSSEKRFCENILEMSKDRDSKWHGVVENAFYPKDEYPRFKGNQLTYSTKALIPGLVYIKTKMNYEIADDIESFNNVYGFSKTRSGIVLPLPKTEAGSLEDIAVRSEKQMNEKYSLLKKDEYVSIIKGPHEGKYGILQGTKRGKLEVILRGDYKDEWDLFDLKEVEYLENPPEKKWNEMSAKEAIESLMAKDPYNPTIKALKKEGVLADILYPDRKVYEPQPGTQRRIRSIAKGDNKHKRDSWNPQRQSEEFYDEGSNSRDDDDGFGEEDNEDLDDFLEGLLQDGAIDSMLDSPAPAKNAPISEGGSQQSGGRSRGVGNFGRL